MNMTAAAESLYISQPSVSQVIKELEDFYGVRLFQRIAKKLHPTPEGDLLYKYAIQILGMFDEAQKEIHQLSENGEITIGANISVGTVLLDKYINSYKELYPDVKIKIKVTGSAKLSKMICDHSIDFALMEDLVYDTSLVQEPFYEDKIVVVCAPDNELAEKKNLSFADLRDQDFLLREKGAGVRDKFDYIMKLNNITVDPVWEASNTRSLVNAVKSSYGIAVLPYLLVMDDIKSGEIVELDMAESLLNRNLSITYHKDKIFNKWAKELLELFRRESSVNPVAEEEENREIQS
ncbi:MAG: LysR family transcriptional regulator [Firmicutes bacterium]|nr:LysR family transcriptional regulator [Bacillota bacterium]